jgi:anti-sigma factor RsiW
MAPELKHGEIQELLGVYALDAVDDDERDIIEAHLAGCPRCRAEVTEHRQAATMLAFSGTPAPDAVWSKISASLDEAPPPLDLAPVRTLRPRRPHLARAFAAVAAAAVVVGLLGGVVIRQNHRIDRLATISAQRGLAQAAAAAAITPGARAVHLRSNDGVQRVDAVVLPSGQGYLVQSHLPRLTLDRTYQLWGVIDAQTISLGVIGAAPTVTPFKAAGPLSALAITAERRGGAVSPTSSPVVQGFLG